MKTTVGILVVLLISFPATAADFEEEARELEGKLMAPCCWSQPVSKHYSAAANEIRREVRQMLAEGKAQQEIINSYVTEYGERILAMPPARGFNLLAYVLPGVFLILGGWGVFVLLRHWRREKPAEPSGKPQSAIADEKYAERLERELWERGGVGARSTPESGSNI